jgi:hypothetical protein
MKQTCATTKFNWTIIDDEDSNYEEEENLEGLNQKQYDEILDQIYQK